MFEDALIYSNVHNIGKYSGLSGEINFDKEEVLERIEDKKHFFKIRKIYGEEYFDLFVKVIRKKVEFDSDEIAIFVAWRLIANMAIKYFSNLWEREYGDIFEGIDNMQIDQCIEIYCGINNINATTVKNVAIFTYYLMNNNVFEENMNFLVCFNASRKNSFLKSCM